MTYSHPLARTLPPPENDDGPDELTDAGYARAMRAADLLHAIKTGTPVRVSINPDDPDPCDLAPAEWQDARAHEPDEPEEGTSHAPDPSCYACHGTGSVIGFGAQPGNQCPCTTGPTEY